MAADAFGMDLSAVGVILSGRVFLAPENTTLPTPAELSDPDWVLPAAFVPAGLLTTDGGFDWTLEPDGDPTEFFQDGYQLPSGLATAELKIILAQTDAVVREIQSGKVPDANGYLTIDAGGHSKRWVLYVEEIYVDGRIRRRITGAAGVKTAKEVSAERGSVRGYETTFKINRHAALNNEHIGEALIAA